jgi:4-hydroxy-tetrahydrodipicolinate reductase
MNRTQLAINGAAGRMGRRLIALSVSDPELELAAAMECPGHPELGTDAGTLAAVGPLGVPLTLGLDAAADLVIDFSVPDGTAAIVAICLQRKIPLVAATTGLNDAQQAMVRSAAETIPIVWAPNMSPAVNLLMQLSATAARALRDCPTGVDVEIIERHHRFKRDAPSGTALAFGQTIADILGPCQVRHGREGEPGPRSQNEIAYHAVRAGDDPGQHTIVFGMLGETIELRVAATSRDAYAHGALAAAKFLVGKPPGLYDMFAVLGLDAHGSL